MNTIGKQWDKQLKMAQCVHVRQELPLHFSQPLHTTRVCTHILIKFNYIFDWPESRFNTIQRNNKDIISRPTSLSYIRFNYIEF